MKLILFLFVKLKGSEELLIFGNEMKNICKSSHDFNALKLDECNTSARITVSCVTFNHELWDQNQVVAFNVNTAKVRQSQTLSHILNVV